MGTSIVTRVIPWLRRAWCLGAALALASPAAFAQTNTARISGNVTGPDGAPVVDAQVSARNTATNVVRNALTSESGFYVLPGLQPGEYVVSFRRIGFQPQEQRIQAGIGQALAVNARLGLATAELSAVQVIAAPAVVERSAEVATNVSQEQIENLPLNERNFLDLALLAPGVRQDGGSITSGAQSANNINVYIDGASYKSDILVGGVAGQDASKGNPFPQNAIQEFRVITQQYKAEYQKATSAIITATTKSGTNTWSGDVFALSQTEGLIAQSYATKKTCEANQAADPPRPCTPRPELDKWQLGGSIGGPIIRDKLFVFGSYENNRQTRAGTVTLGNSTTGMPTALLDSLRTFEGTFESPFRSHLLFGKLTYNPLERHRIELSANIRDEYDIRNFSGTNSYDNAENFYNDVDTYQLKHQYSRSNWLNEAAVSFQSYRWNPVPLFEEKVGLNYSGVMKIGGRSTRQDFDQRRWSLRNDLSYTRSGWFGDHVFKTGANLDLLDYRIMRFLNGVPQYTFNNTNSWAFPIQAQAGFGDPNLSTTNNQFGIFLQDDWTVTSRLALNLGVRWDYESNMFNNDYVTPDSIRQAVADFVETLPCDGTDPKREQLCDPSPYLTDGDDRPAFMKAIQPRLGFSYDVFGNGNTALFGGWGIYYDRNRYGNVLSENAGLQWTTYTFRFSADGMPQGGNPTIQWEDRYLTREGLLEILAGGSAPRPELFLAKNSTKPPMARQATIGVRQSLFGSYGLSASYTTVRGYNTYTWIRANRRADGTCCNQLPGYTNVFVSSDDARNWYDAFYFMAEKRYSEDSKWGLQLSYTLGFAEEEADAGGVFSALNVFTVDDFERYPSGFDERHRVTTNWVIGLPFAIKYSGILDLGTGGPFNATVGFGPGTNNCTAGNADCVSGNDFPPGKSRNWFRPDGEDFIIPDFWRFRNIDMRLEKQFPTLRGQRIGLVAEAFNVFDWPNFTSWDLQWGQYQTDGSITRNANFGKRNNNVIDNGGRGSPRRFQLGMTYKF